MAAPFGSLKPVSATEDLTVYEYVTPRRLGRGLALVLPGLVLLAAAFGLGPSLGTSSGWALGIVPLALGVFLAARGFRDLVTRSYFQLEVDVRARTLALSMELEGDGTKLAKVGFDRVRAVELAGTDGRWTVSLLLQDGRRMGIGLFEVAGEAEELTSRFSALVGAPIARLKR
jgi:hypothetical protein